MSAEHVPNVDHDEKESSCIHNCKDREGMNPVMYLNRLCIGLELAPQAPLKRMLSYPCNGEPQVRIRRCSESYLESHP